MRSKLFSLAFVAAFLFAIVPAFADTVEDDLSSYAGTAVHAARTGDAASTARDASGAGDAPATDAARDASGAGAAFHAARTGDATSPDAPGDQDDTTNPDDEPQPPAKSPVDNAPDTVEGNQAAITATETVEETVAVDKQDMHRLYNPNSGEHFYTASIVERDHLVSVGWSYEGIGWMAPLTSDHPVFRLYNPNAGDHHYTLSSHERDTLVSVGWNDEGIGWYSALESEGRPVLRQYNPNAIAGAHNFTTDANEDATLTAAGWNAEGIAWYALASDTKTIQTSTSTVLEKAPYLSATFATADGAVPESIVSYAKGDATYLFLPSYAPLDSIYLSAHESRDKRVNLFVGNGKSFSAVNPEQAIDLLALGATRGDDGSIKLRFKTAENATEFSLVVMQSANVPALYVNSANLALQGRDYVEASPDHSAKANVLVYMVESDGNVVYGEDVRDNKKKLSTIKGRGNSTWGNGIKKPYQISLSTKTDLMGGNAPAKKWILLANSADASLIHSSVAFDLAAELGLATVDTRPIDLYYDGEYRGSYLLAEKIEIKPGRVDIFDLEEAIEDANAGTDLELLPTMQATNKYGNTFQYVSGVKDPASIEGGYLIELDVGYYAKEACWFTAVWPGNDRPTQFVLKSPEFASKAALIFISEAMQEAMNNLGADKLADGSALADGSFAFDLDSLAKMHLLEEFLKNNDTYSSSTYFTLEMGSKIFRAGPVWDFDAGMGTRIDAQDSIQSTYWGYYLDLRAIITSNTVKKRIQEIYDGSFKDLIDKVILGDKDAVGPKGKLHSIAYYADRITASQRMNEIPFGVTSFSFQAEPFATWALNVEFFAKWLGWRSAWFSANMNKFGSVTLTEPERSTRWYDGIDYGHVFDYQYYLANNPQLASQGIKTSAQALRHFVTIGMHDEKYAGTTARNFDVRAYMRKNPQLKKELGDDIAAYYLHYCTQGFKKGLVGWA